MNDKDMLRPFLRNHPYVIPFMLLLSLVCYPIYHGALGVWSGVAEWWDEATMVYGIYRRKS